MRKNLRDRRLLLAVHREFRPAKCNLVFVAKRAALDEHRGRHPRDALGGRPHIDERVARPGARPPAIRETTPEIDNAAAAMKRGECGANFLVVALTRKILRKCFARRLETRRNGAFDPVISRHLSSDPFRQSARKPLMNNLTISSPSACGARGSSNR